MQPHPELGRAGPVCPFVSASLRAAAFHLAVCAGADLDRREITAQVDAFREWFRELPQAGGRKVNLTTVLILFPDVRTSQAPELIDGVQAELKGGFVAAGLMIGQFHPLPPDQAGLWNADFRPLRSPVPMLVIRHMVGTDLPFLAADPRHTAAYDRLFGTTTSTGA
nr:hypothetical protein [Pseudonocardia sp. TRM90224]